MTPEQKIDLRLKILEECLQPKRRTRVVDVGANPLEEPPYEALLRTGIGEVFAFEPQDSARARLEEIKPDNMHILPYAVGDGRKGVLHICSDSGFTSLLSPNPAFFDYLGQWHDSVEITERVGIETQQLDAISEIPSIDLLKIDIQGGEQAVFAHGQKHLSNALAVITEVAAMPLYIDQPLLDDQMRSLRTLGFHLHKFLFFKSAHIKPSPGQPKYLRPRRHRNQLVDGDAVFLRDPFGIGQMQDEELKHLAIIADSTFQSFDITMNALSHLNARGLLSKRDLQRYAEQVPDSLPAAD